MPATTCTWPLAPNETKLDADQVHVWCVRLQMPDAEVTDLKRLLSEDERERAERFRFDYHRRRFIVCRGRQRQILAHYLDSRPERICFRYGAFGKPSLEGPFCERRICFNVTNSGEIALLAVTLDREVGVDVERIREMSDFVGLARRYFAAAECVSLFALPADQQLDAFFRCWTRKEAMLKATGKGLTFPLDRVVVSLAPDEPAEVISFDGEPHAPRHWWLHEVLPADGYIAAIASTGDVPELRHWTWSE